MLVQCVFRFLVEKSMQFSCLNYIIVADSGYLRGGPGGGGAALAPFLCLPR